MTDENRLPEASRYIHDLGVARIDSGRQARTGMPEAVFAEGKSVDDLRVIINAHDLAEGPLIVTRANPAHLDAIAQGETTLTLHREARMATRGRAASSGRRASVLTGGTSDRAVAEEAAITLDTLGHEVTRHYDVGVAGLHRLLAVLPEVAQSDIVIVIAGMEGALPSVLGGLCQVPMIAVPTSIGYGAHYQGLAALLGMLNSCAPGITVVNIDNGFGAAVAAHRFLRRLKQISV